ncbi:hypothetical protein TRFO_17575 [Tritrichomonas foetus]|uniref:KATNIP domain-containing protein n=1 Tax=Tritrichomonas foetus TaxID=1144522 RepID=A0A1J4KMJ9_9EUKA|nr:hypothetical protein TRFO_17575 [Tritrichomonas foetus]|eukprot:OHT12529.1 hypothetical protein TRFO_17575 [Tritrichomonas foetus]
MINGKGVAAVKSCFPMQTFASNKNLSLAKSRNMSNVKTFSNLIHPSETKPVFDVLSKRKSIALINVNSCAKKAVKYRNLNKLNKKIIIIKIESTWGNSSEITLSSLAIYDEQKKPIPVTNISSIPDPSNLSSLDGILTETYHRQNHKSFCEKFEKGFSIILSIENMYEPKVIRILNSFEKLNSAVKCVSIYEGTSLVSRGIIPQQFGTNLQLVKNEFESYKMMILPKVKAFTDQYGILPIKPVTQIDIQVLETYNNVNKLGINGIDLVDIHGQLVSCEDISEIHVNGVENAVNRSLLLRPNKETNDFHDMFLSDVIQGQIPSITFILKKPMYISKVFIWNFNAERRSLRFGIKKVKIRENGKCIWCGKIPIGTGKVFNLEKTVQCAVLHEVPENMIHIEIQN